MNNLIKINVTHELPCITLEEVPNGALFVGTIDGYVSAGPFVKIGSCSAKLWVVAKLEAIDGAVFTSNAHRETKVSDYRRLFVREIDIKVGTDQTR